MFVQQSAFLHQNKGSRVFQCCDKIARFRETYDFEVIGSSKEFGQVELIGW